MVTKMKSTLFKTVFKNIRYKRRALFQPPALNSFAWLNNDPKMPSISISSVKKPHIFNQSQKQKINNQTPKKGIKINY